jgi:Tfp pilus assembly protein PilF
MFKVKQLVCMMGCVSLVGGCALYQGRDKETLSIKPVMDVKHSAGGSEAMYWLGRYHQGKVNYREAIAAYEKALAANPGHVEAHNGLGISYSLHGRHELALQHFRKAIELSPAATHLHNNLGYAHLVRGQESEAAFAFEAALQLDPENRQARDNLGAVYGKMGLHDQAAVLTLARSQPAVAPAAISTTESAPAPGNSPATMPPGTITVVEEQSMQQDVDTRLVQIAPHVFEFRMAEVDRVVAILTDKNTGETITPHNSRKVGSQNIRIEVSNGNGVAGMARQVSAFLQQNGFAKARLTDRQPFQQIQTEIRYRPGYYVLAGQISQMMPKKARLLESSDLRSDIQVRVLLGKDVARETGYFDGPRKIRIAQLPEKQLSANRLGNKPDGTQQ